MSLTQKLAKKLLGLMRQPALSHTGKEKHRLLFVFQGRQGQWDGMGQRLYRNSRVFRDSVQRCSNQIEARNGVALVDSFKSLEASVTINNNEFQAITGHALIHIGLTDYWKDKGVVPDATIGLSLGEITSAYVNQSLSLEDTMAVARSVALWDERLPAKGKLIIAQAGLKTALQLVERCPVKTEVFGELGPSTTLLFTAHDEVEQASAFLDENNCEHLVYIRDSAYHTTRFTKCKPDMLGELAHIEPRSPVHRYYSGLSGGVASSGLCLDANFYYWMVAKPTLFNSAFEAALADGYDTILNIGPHPALTQYMQEAADKLGKEIVILDSMRNDESELTTLRKTLKVLQKRGLVGRDNADLEIDRETTRTSFEHNPYVHYQALRKIAPVHYSSERKEYLVLNYDAVAAGLRQPELFSSHLEYGLDSVLVNADPPEHTKARKLLAPYFSPQRMAAFAEMIERQADKLLQKLTADFDVVFDFAVPLTEIAIADIIGISDSDRKQIQALTGRRLFELEISVPPLTEFFDNYTDNENLRDTNEFCRQLMTGGPDTSFSQAEVSSLMKVFWIAGTTTTSMLIATAMKTLLHQPAIRHELTENKSLIPQFLEEVLRFDTPQRTAWRVATADTTIEGQPIKRGDTVRFCLAAANRDANHFADPDLFDLFRQPRDHMSFGYGIHSCIGAHLSRIEARIAVDKLLGRFPDMRASVSEHELDYVPTDDFRALKELRVITGYNYSTCEVAT